MKKVFVILSAVLLSTSLFAEDHVMAATKSYYRTQDSVPSSLSLSLRDAQNYAIKQNRSLRNASLAVQEAYAQRWQTIAAMLPQVDGSYSYSNYLGYSATMSTAMGEFTINMPNVGALGATASVGINGQGIVGVLLNNIAIDMKKISLDKSESELRGSVMSSYVSLLALQSITELLDSSLVNIQNLESITQNAVNAGAAEQTTADQIRVRVNTMKNNINIQRRNIELATNSLKVLLDVPVETELTLTDSIDDILSPERVISLLSENFRIENNLNYQLLQKQVELAKRNVHMAGWAYGPTVALAYNYTNQQYYGEGGMRMTPPNVIQVSVKMPLWSSGKRAAGVVEKKIALEEAKNTLSETTDNLAIQYRQLCFDLTNAYETYMNEKDNIEVAQRVFKSQTEKFKWGAASHLELTNASNDLINAQSTYVNAMLSLVNAQVELETFLNN
ncbi:MAG: TolC family protein [Paludibacteraceae bacterium]|nr:TolC family protein [Paludibacteraceae bacterium]MBR1381297.1 TolC family protein [Paludibacteraceae bacterium]MDY6380217.1 TolC family protein [Bacteroidales bacterium]MDY6406809.1 TolC family protein [Bacteroidales bacterium]